MLLALILAHVTAPSSPQGPIFTNPATMTQLPFFSAFGTDGRGTFGACSSTAPTGAKGETLTWTGPTASTCTKGTNGLRTTAIADGDLVPLANKPRVELDPNGVAGLLVEASDTSINLQARPICNAAWADLGTPNCTANVTTGPWGTTTMGRLTDDDAAATEGRTQTIATTSATRFTVQCYVKAGTATSAGVLLQGTGSAAGDCSVNVTGLSTTTSTIVTCTSAVAYAGTLTSVLVGVAVGTIASDTGTIFVEGCDVKPSSPGYRTSINDTTTASYTRAAEAAYFVISMPTAGGYSHAHTFTNAGVASFDGATGIFQDALNRSQLYQFSSNALGGDLFTTSGNRGTTVVSGVWVAGTPYRVAMSYSGAGASSTVSTYLAGVLQGTSATGLTSSFTATQYGLSLNSPWAGTNSIYTRLCADPDSTRCR